MYNSNSYNPIKLKNCIKIIFLCFPFFSNYYQISNNTVYTAFIIWKIGVFVYLISVVGKWVLRRCDKYVFSLILWMLCYFVATLTGEKTSLVKLLGYVMTCFCTCFIMLYNIQIRNEPRKTVYALLLTFRIQVYINFILMLIFPNGIYSSESIYRTEAFRYNFIGLDNQICPYVLVLLALSMFYGKQYSYSKRCEGYLDIIICLVSFVLLNSATGYIGLASYFAVLFCLKYGKRMFNLKRLVLVVAILTITILFLRNLTIFGDLFALFGKDITLSGRTNIWQSAIFTALKKPFLGHGITIENIVYYATMRDYRSAHDEYLQIILNGGILGLLSFCAMLKYVIKAYTDSKLKDNKIPLLAGFIAMLIMMITETYVQMVCFLFLISVIYYLSITENNCE